MALLFSSSSTVSQWHSTVQLIHWVMSLYEFSATKKWIRASYCDAVWEGNLDLIRYILKFKLYLPTVFGECDIQRNVHRDIVL
jgi:hypothetical protein